MCLGVPMQIIEVTDNRALAESLGIRREIALGLLEQPWPQPGEYVMVHVGYAISRVEPAVAQAAWDEWARLHQIQHA